MLETTAGELANDEGMREDLFLEEEIREAAVGHPPVVDPDGRIDEDHARGRRRGMRRTFLSVPPKVARRRELARATSASRPARTTAVFSRRPLSSVARSKSRSSILSVVRICISMAI